jgi:PAS domain S-box-containing protein
MADDDAQPTLSETPAGFFLGILDVVAHPIFVKDRAFRFVFLNRAVCAMVGFSREQMLGKTDHDFFPKQESDFFRAKDVEMFESGRAVVIDEEPITDARGKRHVLSTTKVPLRDASGAITHLVGITHDITRLKIAEESLRQANAELERRVEERSLALAAAREDLDRKERLAVLGRLAGGVAHEIRNPLAAIRGAAQILARHAKAGGDMPAVVAIIQEEVARADRIIADLVDYARVRPPTRRPVAAGYVVAQALGGQTLPCGVRVETDLPDLPDAVLDPEQVQVALSNLLRNAIEAMGERGTLRVTTRLEGAHIVVRISDTGPGLSHAAREKLFEPLVTTKPHGLGLGLVTARALVENQGGALVHVDGLDAGAIFEAHLPTK